ncbi:metallophosphatase family protein [Sphingobacterium sp. SRCM116780]|uniref:metallophosphoesterase family protein n=1 Tax=Sphingobacterium sp. SRCM116780 TaxID=2907623 RepID=UPI001F4121EC|nr:metallophosphoesterase family protein [Sphingobacterium sp. SRCM116780]UIR57095.1 metallophosphatase family protein [Sphingobacterium sp. SRCM116780]
MIQIAIFSDVHGNLPALEAVLADIAARGIQQTYCLGDLVDFAPWGNEVIERIQEEQIPCLLGNHDERIAYDLPIIPLPKHTAEETACRILAIQHSKNNILEKNKAFLAQLPYLMQLDIQVNQKHWCIQLAHGSTESNEHYLYETEPDATFTSLLAEAKADILLMGHTHLSFIKSFGNKWAINVGSVGRSKEQNKDATYLLLQLDEDHIQAEIIRIPYAMEEVIDKIKASDIPDFYANFLASSQAYSTT